MKRRDLLKGLGVTAAVPAAPLVAHEAPQDTATDPARLPRAAVFQQQTYFNFDGNGEVYSPPAGNKSTVEYRASLSEEEFLRRHWFS